MEKNPYGVLGVAPWSTWETIETRYNSLVKDANNKNKNSQDFKSFNQAYEKIKILRNIVDSKNHKDDVFSNFIEVLLVTLKKTILGVLYMILLYYIIYYIFTIYEELFIHLIITWVFKNSFENMFPHIFRNDIYLYVASVIVFLISILNHEYITKIRNLLR